MRRQLSQILSLGLLCLLSGCGKPPVVPSTLTPAEKTELTDALNRLDDVLKTKVPTLHANLNPPAGKTDIDNLRAALDGNTVESLEMWFQWHNGISGAPGSLLPLGYPLSVQETLDDRQMMQTIPLVEGKRRSVVKLLEDGSGDGFFLDVTSSRPLVYYEMLEDPGELYYGTLAEFVNFIADAFEAEVLSVNAAGEFEYDMTEYQAFEADFLNSATKP